jgi:hypothetical protein
MARTQVGVAADECLHREHKLRIKSMYTLLSAPYSSSRDLEEICNTLACTHKATHDPIVKIHLAKAIDLIDEINLHQ